MAKIYAKTSDQTLILAPREGLLRQFDLGTDWTEIRLGMYASFVRSSDDNAAPSGTETVTVATVADRITFGIKDSGTALPGVATSRFLGIATPDSVNSQITADVLVHGTDSKLSACGFTDTTKVINASVANTIYQNNVATPSASATTYNTFLGLKIVLANRGLASQTATITAAISAVAPVVTSVYSVTSLGSDIQNATYGSMGAALAWNNGATAYDIPDCFWFRMPFYNNRIRISAMRVTRFV